MFLLEKFSRVLQFRFFPFDSSRKKIFRRKFRFRWVIFHWKISVLLGVRWLLLRSKCHWKLQSSEMTKEDNLCEWMDDIHMREDTSWNVLTTGLSFDKKSIWSLFWLKAWTFHSINVDPLHLNHLIICSIIYFILLWLLISMLFILILSVSSKKTREYQFNNEWLLIS